MAQAILLCSMGGDNFHCSANSLVIVSEEQKTQWIDGGIARELLSTEPSELQLATAKDFTATNKSEPTQPAVVEQTPQPKPSKRKKPDAV